MIYWNMKMLFALLEVNANVEFTDVWTFPSVKTYKGKHPAEKPV